MYAERRFEGTPIELPVLEDWRRVLLRAAVLVERGWCQGAAAFDDGRVCMVQAILNSANQLEANREQKLIARDRVCARFGGHLGFAFLWNDTPGRTQAEVIAVLRECARG